MVGTAARFQVLGYDCGGAQRRPKERWMADLPPLNRISQFAYTCNRCMSCCHGPHIALDPYEIARLARNRQLNTTEFIARYLTEGGIVLRNREDTSCVMLGAEGCTVYADRPQICRTYPLKRIDRKSVV